MPWKVTTTMEQRTSFIVEAQADGVNFSELCRAYGISRKTGYKWLVRYEGEGREGLAERSRRPHHSPHQTSLEVEAQLLDVRDAHPAWGARKLKRYLEDQGVTGLPAVSTITAILRRHGRLDETEGVKHRAHQRFERAAPNELWQMDFKGYIELGSGQPCHPLSVIDDHSRFLVGLRACVNQTQLTVQKQLTRLFGEYGLPERMLMDNGSPWGNDADTPHTKLTVWLMRLGIAISHGRAYHPQTQGKVERFHRTLTAEVVLRTRPTSLRASQQAFDEWRTVYNCQRPHEALDLATPHTRYVPSPRPFPDSLPPLVYPHADLVRKVDSNGRITLQNRFYSVSKAFRGQPVGVCFDPLTDGLVHVYFATTLIRTIALKAVQ